MAPKPITLTVSEGRLVELRTIDLAELMMNGEIPDYLTTLVEFMIARTLAARGFASLEEHNAVEAMLSPGEEQQRENNERMVQLVRLVVRLGTSNPIICSDFKEARELRAAGKPTAHISQYSREDLFSIFFRSQGVAADLIPFLLGALFQEQPVEALSDGAGVAPAAEQPAGDPAGAGVGELHGGLGRGAVGAVRRGRAVGDKRKARASVDNPAAAGKP